MYNSSEEEIHWQGASYLLKGNATTRSEVEGMCSALCVQRMSYKRLVSVFPSEAVLICEHVVLICSFDWPGTSLSTLGSFTPLLHNHFFPLTYDYALKKSFTSLKNVSASLRLFLVFFYKESMHLNSSMETKL